MVENEIRVWDRYPDNTCTTCPHPPGFDFEFDLETKLRIVPDWIQDKIDEDKD